MSLSTFVDDEGGYTTVAMAVALLVSLTLVFSAAASGWAMARSAEVQEIADAAALAGSNSVAAFSTVSQVSDACVVTMGLAGIMVLGTGLVVSAIPYVQSAAPQIMKSGHDILNARNRFATSAAKGLSQLERALPAIVMANSASCVSANCGDTEYVGFAVPFPQTSETDWSFLEDGVDGSDIEESAEELREATAKKEQALEQANEAKLRAWRADCVDDPLCMRSRAQTLAGLSGTSNPNYASVNAWKFEYARLRALNYYRTRLAQEAPESDDPEELTRSAGRRAFYEYASREIAKGRCIEGDQAVMDLPDLPHTPAMVRESTLYTDVVWPCSELDGRRTLHSTLACPAASGTPSGNASLAELEQGSVARCDTCGMDAVAMGSVANASTNINNGFEHYWRIVVEASRDYQEARERAQLADDEMSELAEQGSSLFDEAIRRLGVDRPKVRPAGYMGCVSIVVRKGGTSVPTELTASLIPGMELPAGVAMSGATLAPDDATDGNTVLSRVFDGLKEGWGTPVEMVGSVTELWGRLLAWYGSSYGDLSGITDELLGGIGSLFGETVATWIRDKVSLAVETCGLEPADLRLRKPVLVKTQQVLDQAGLTTLGEARRLIQALPSNGEQLSAQSLATVLAELGGGNFTVAELPIPGLDGVSIPLRIDLSKLVGAL